MLKHFLHNFNKLPDSNKSMVYLMWIYEIWAIITNTFVNIYVFKLYNLLENIVTYNIIFLNGTFIWFSFLGFLMSKYKKDIKNMYYISYILFVLSFILLFFFNSTLFWVYLFWIIFWLWNWAFWCAVHTQELKNILNKNRDFYSSSISAGSNIVSVLVPLFVAILFYISWIYKFDGYLILFLILPIIYLISFVFIKNIDSYTPGKVFKKDIKNFFDLWKYKFWHFYFFVGWIRLWLLTSVLAVISIILLKTEENIWLFQAILTLISTFVVMHLSHRREEENRLKYYFRVSLSMTLLYIFFWLFFWLTSYIIFSFILLFTKPISRVSEHVFDLSMMDNIKTSESDFYPAMLFREVILWTWRMSWLLILLLMYYFSWLELNNILKIGLILIWFTYIFLYFWANFWEKYEKHHK